MKDQWPQQLLKIKIKVIFTFTQDSEVDNASSQLISLAQKC